MFYDRLDGQVSSTRIRAASHSTQSRTSFKALLAKDIRIIRCRLQDILVKGIRQFTSVRLLPSAYPALPQLWRSCQQLSLQSVRSVRMRGTSRLFSTAWSSINSLHALPPSIRQSISRSPVAQQLITSRSAGHRHNPLFVRRHVSTQHSSTATSPSQIVRPLVPPPSETSGPLLSRRADRALPNLPRTNIWLKTLPIFIILVTASSLAIFNYQKSSSSTINSILYALRTNEAAREILGDEIYFASKVPWIRGEMNQMHGVIDVRFWVKGTRAQAETKFVSLRARKTGYFETLEWSLKLEDGTVVQLLEDGNARGGNQPMINKGEQ